jgi:hypothetical protein
MTSTWVAPFFWVGLWHFGHWGGNPRWLVAGEGFKGGGEDLLAGVFNTFFQIVEGHGFGEGFVECVNFIGELVDEVLALFWAEFWHGLGYFIPHYLRCTLPNAWVRARLVI